MGIRVEIRRIMRKSVRKCYNLVCNHPILLGFLCFLFLLYRSFPVLFSLLVSASPVLVCTAVLLGTLLSFGEPRLPEIEKEERVSTEMCHLKTGVSGNSTVLVSRGESSTGERFMGDKRDIIERAVERAVSSSNEARMLGHEDGLLEIAPLIYDQSSLETQVGNVKREYEEVDGKEEDEGEGDGKGQDLDDGEVGEHQYNLIEDAEDDVQSGNTELKRESVDSHAENLVGSELKRVNKDEDEEDEEGDGKGQDLDDDEVGEHQYSLIEDAEDDVRSENHELTRESTDAHVESLVGSELKGVDKDEEEEEEEDGGESLDSESDHAESSSPDASMADISLMLDEIHPLLEGEARQPRKMSHNDSDVDSEHSGKSENGNVESDNDSESKNDDDEEEEEEEEEDEESQMGGKGDASDCGITWTEDDQKNLMDLGTSELERNQRLENLIARRRARRALTERNLIDFEGTDLPFNVPSITTSRGNPFDGPDDSYSNMGLPPIPGSAPSILLLRRNPFDLPYEPNEEKPDLKEDSFKQEFISSPPMNPPYQNQQRDNFFFRRHESFGVGPSRMGISRQERKELKWKPYFVPEHFNSEEASFRSFERQSSGMSDSKASSVPDTESVTSIVDHEDKGVNESEEFLHETEEMSNLDRASLYVERGSVTSEDHDHQETDEEEEERNARHDEIEITLGDAEADAESHRDTGSSLSEEGIGNDDFVPPLDVSINGFDVKRDPLEAEEEEVAEEEGEEEGNENISGRSSGSSSLSVLSEDNEKIDEVKNERGEASISQINYPDEELRPRVEDVEFSFRDDHHKEPVYDSSPQAVSKHLSFSSDSSELPAKRELEVLSENMQSDDCDNENVASDSDAKEIGEYNLQQDRSSEYDQLLAEDNGIAMLPEFVNGQVSNVSGSPLMGIESTENDLVNDSHFRQEHIEIKPGPSNTELTERAMESNEHFQAKQVKIDEPSSHDISVDNVAASNHDLVQHEEDQRLEMGTDVQFHDTIQRKDTPASSHWDMFYDLSGGPLHANEPFIPEGRSEPLEELSEMDEEQLTSDHGPSFDETNEEPESVAHGESIVTNPSENPEGTHDDGSKDSVVIFAVTSKSPSFSSASSNYQSPTIGTDSRDHPANETEIGILHRQISQYYDPSEVSGSLYTDEASNRGGDDEIDVDEGFLTELDTVGDFRVEETCNEVESKGGHSERESLEHSGSGSDLPVLEARSLEDSTMAFGQLHEIANFEELIVPSSIDDGLNNPEGAEPNLLDNYEEVPEETRDMEASGSKGVSAFDELNDSDNSIKISSNLSALKEKLVEDVTTASMQMKGADTNEDVILPSSIKDQQESTSLNGTSSSGLPVVEMRSTEDIHSIMKQAVGESHE